MSAFLQVLCGTSSWTSPSWVGPFYPAGTASSDFLPHYSARFRTVEIDATWYRCPTAKTVDGWAEKTPDDFVFAAKVPRSITHEQVLLDCEGELEEFVGVMRRLGPKLGPLLLQFPYFNQQTFPGVEPFLARLRPFLKRLPEDVRFAVEIRNKPWLGTRLFDTLQAAGVALAWIDHPWMPTARYYARGAGLTTDFAYVRWLGDRHGIERVTTSWDRLVYDRTRQLELWADTTRRALGRVAKVYAYANNHYAGCGYQTAEQFQRFFSPPED
ncbi:MAG: DUF72 domain-containing protein [Armatimonadota bacterium]